MCCVTAFNKARSPWRSVMRIVTHCKMLPTAAIFSQTSHQPQNNVQRNLSFTSEANFFDTRIGHFKITAAKDTKFKKMRMNGWKRRQTEENRKERKHLRGCATDRSKSDVALVSGKQKFCDQTYTSSEITQFRVTIIKGVPVQVHLLCSIQADIHMLVGQKARRRCQHRPVQ
jgi:hypothetical protein